MYELDSKGRGIVVGYTGAINHYVANDGREFASIYERYQDRKKDGRSRAIENKASRIFEFLEKKDKAFYSVDIKKELSLKSIDSFGFSRFIWSNFHKPIPICLGGMFLLLPSSDIAFRK